MGYKIRINGLNANTKYKFQIRSKLIYRKETIYSKWSRPTIEFSTKPQQISIMTDHRKFLQKQLEEYKAKCQQLQKENDALQLEIQSLRPPHLNWNYQQCIEWILRINNGIFSSYKQTLSNTFKQQQINGSNLHKLDVSALHKLGIRNFAHKKILISHIHKLTQNDQIPDIQYDHRVAHTVKSPKTNNIDNESYELFPIQDDHYKPPAQEKKIKNKLHELNTIQDEKEEENDDIDYAKFSKSSPVIPMMSNINSANDYGLSKSQKALLCSNGSNEPLKTWKYKDGMLSVYVIKAENVDNMDEDEGPGSASDPYVELELKGHYKREQTKVKQNNANPVWKE